MSHQHVDGQVSGRWTEVATRIAREVHRNHRDGHKLANLSSLVHAFRVPGAPTRIADVHGALSDQGLVLEPSIEDLRRSSVVHISSVTPPEDVERPDLVRRSDWTPGRCPIDVSAAAAPSDAVRWFDVSPVRACNSVGQARTADAEIVTRAAEIFDLVREHCPGLELDMVRDLLREDVQPKVETYGDDDGDVRGVSFVAVVSRENDGGGELVFQLVEIITGPGWLVTCWHPSRVVGGAEDARSERSLLREPFLSHVRSRWISETSDPTVSGSSANLGLYLVEALIDTFDATHRMVERWLSAWEVEFSTSLIAAERAERLKSASSQLSNYLHMTAEVRRRLTAFHHARHSTSSQSWFRAPVTPTIAHEVEAAAESAAATKVDAARENFAHLAHDIQSNMDQLMLQSSATQQEATERVQSSLALITGLVLVPTFVAGMFGANTRLPGGGSWFGFDLMIGLMVASGVATFWYLRRIGRR